MVSVTSSCAAYSCLLVYSARSEFVNRGVILNKASKSQFVALLSITEPLQNVLPPFPLMGDPSGGTSRNARLGEIEVGVRTTDYPPIPAFPPPPRSSAAGQLALPPQARGEGIDWKRFCKSPVVNL